MDEPDKPRRRRDTVKGQSQYTAAKHAAQDMAYRFQVLLGFVLILGTAGALIYLFFFHKTPEVNPIDYDQNYRVLSKQMVTGSVIAGELKLDAPSKEFADWVDPKFYIICEADFSGARVVFDAPESAYNGTPIGSTLTGNQVKKWKIEEMDSPTLIQVLERKTGLSLKGDK